MSKEIPKKKTKKMKAKLCSIDCMVNFENGSQFFKQWQLIVDEDLIKKIGDNSFFRDVDISDLPDWVWEHNPELVKYKNEK